MITCRLITEAVAAAYSVPVLQLYSRRRDAGTVLPRHMAWTLASRLTTQSYSAIGRHMGGRDHATVMHGVAKIRAALETDAQIATNYQALVDAVTLLADAGQSAERLRQCFNDIDPLDVAERILSSAFRDVLPSMEEIRALCFGVTHYAAECQRLYAEHGGGDQAAPNTALTDL